MGWGPPAFDGDTPEETARKRAAFTVMTDLGVLKDQALGLLSRFALERVERQAEWIGHRNAENPGRYLAAAAIEGNSEMPLGLRARQAPHPGPGDAFGGAAADNSEPGKAKQERQNMNRMHE